MIDGVGDVEWRRERTGSLLRLESDVLLVEFFGFFLGGFEGFGFTACAVSIMVPGRREGKGRARALG
jgi:hypothetical protein